MDKEQKILLTGGSGNLGTEMQKFLSINEKNIDDIAPDLKELDITDLKKCVIVMDKYNPDIIVHAAAYTDVSGAEKNKKQCWDINVIGTQNIALTSKGRRLVYISTDYVFDGEKGNYKESDTPNPVNYYALTKLVGENIIQQYPKTLIIRTAFKPNGKWMYEKAFIDQYSSHEFVTDIAPQIMRAALIMELEGVIHIAGKRKRMYDLAKRVSPNVGTMKRSDVSVHIPFDTSLNISKWTKILKTSSKSKTQKKSQQ